MKRLVKMIPVAIFFIGMSAVGVGCLHIEDDSDDGSCSVNCSVHCNDCSNGCSDECYDCCY